MAVTDNRVAAGHVSAATINGSDTYLIENWALQSDMGGQYIWTPFADALTTYPAPEFIRDYMAPIRKAAGAYLFNVGFKYWTEGQAAYWDTLLSWSDTVWYAPATFKIRRYPGTSLGVIQCVAFRPVPNVDMRRAYKGFEDVVIRCVDGVFV